MAKIDLDEIEASLNYLEDWKNIIEELRAAREVVEAAKNMIGDKSIELKLALKKLDEARRG